MGVTKFVARDDAGASKPTEARVCRTSRQSRHHHEVSFRPCSILGRSPGARCHAHSGLSALSSVLMYYVDRVGPNIVSAIRNREVAHGRYSECFIVLCQWSLNRDRALVAALARCPLLGMSVKRGSTVDGHERITLAHTAQGLCVVP